MTEKEPNADTLKTWREKFAADDDADLQMFAKLPDNGLLALAKLVRSIK
jgi:hypothetical protein|tara:strand:+ start:945 stop:1091 length:147 start_codon:yes stop_codon:yes gene_type:complete